MFFHTASLVFHPHPLKVFSLSDTVRGLKYYKETSVWKLLCSKLFKELQNQVFSTSCSKHLDSDADGFATFLKVWVEDVQQQLPAVWQLMWLDSHSLSHLMKNSLRTLDWLKSSMWSFFLNSQHQLFGFWTFWSLMSKFVLSLLIISARRPWIIQRFLSLLWWKDINCNLQYFPEMRNSFMNDKKEEEADK